MSIIIYTHCIVETNLARECVSWKRKDGFLLYPQSHRRFQNMLLNEQEQILRFLGEVLRQI